MALGTRTFIAPEGRPYLLGIVAVALLITIMATLVWSAPIWLATVFAFYAFRSSERAIPPSPLGIVSPVDGRVLSVRDVADPYLERPVKKICLKCDLFGEYVVRGPLEGKIINQWFTPKGSVPGVKEGETQQPILGKGAIKPSYAMWVQTDEGDDAIVELEYGSWPPPGCYVHVGERVGQGQRCGFMVLGGCINLLLPPESRINVKAGDKVKGGSDIIASFVHA